MQSTAADLRSEVARHRLKLYEIAARAGMHPTRLGAFLNEKLPLRPDTALRIHEAVEAVAADRPR